MIRSEHELEQMGAVWSGPNSKITSDGRYWLQTYERGPFQAHGEPSEFWAEHWRESQVRLVIES